MVRHFGGTIHCVSGSALAFLLFAAAFPAADPVAALEKLKAFARNYGTSLQDFTCSKETGRLESRVPGKRWKQVDRYVEEINYVNHGESRKLIRVGRSGLKSGYTKVGGEFSLLGHIFQTRAQAELVFDRQEGAVCVFRYHVAESTAPFLAHIGREPVRLGHGGWVYSLCATGVVTRLDAASDPEPDKGVAMSTSIRFGPADIGGRQFQMPQTAEDLSRIGRNLTKAEVRFRDYRKYEASSEVHFETEPRIP